ncbi:MAG: hypothetical protein IJ714_03720 [Bacteroidales bacterium]|nr:hypothetical protein [Bacteroidales bacterium]
MPVRAGPAGVFAGGADAFAAYGAAGDVFGGVGANLAAGGAAFAACGGAGAVFLWLASYCGLQVTVAQSLTHNPLRFLRRGLYAKHWVSGR